MISSALSGDQILKIAVYFPFKENTVDAGHNWTHCLSGKPAESCRIENRKDFRQKYNL